MNIDDIKKKLLEFLSLREEVQKLEKAAKVIPFPTKKEKYPQGKDPLHQPSNKEHISKTPSNQARRSGKGVSEAGSDVRGYNADKKAKNPQDDQIHDKISGAGAYAKHKKVLNDLKAQPKPNLPKSEDAVQGVHQQHSMAKPGTSVAGHDYAHGKRIQSQNRKDVLGYLKSALDQHKEKLSELQAQPKPNLPKSELGKANVLPNPTVTTNTVKKDMAKMRGYSPKLDKAVPPKKVYGQNSEPATLNYKQMKQEFKQKSSSIDRQNQIATHQKQQAQAPKMSPANAPSAPTHQPTQKLFDPRLSGKVEPKKG